MGKLSFSSALLAKKSEKKDCPCVFLSPLPLTQHSPPQKCIQNSTNTCKMLPLFFDRGTKDEMFENKEGKLKNGVISVYKVHLLNLRL